MKIIVLGLRGFPNIQGGIEKHCEQLYPKIVEKGHSVTVLARTVYVGKKIYYHKGIKIIPLNSPQNKFFEAFFHTFIGILIAKKYDCDILHIHAVGPALFIPLARILGLKIVMTNHGPDYERKKWGSFAKTVLKLGEYFGSRWANELIFISKPIAESIKNKYGKTGTIIPNGVDIPSILITKDILEKYDLKSKKYILSVGRLVPEKGFHNLIDAYNNIEHNNWKLVIAGDADHETDYSRSIKARAKINNNIILTGFISGTSLGELYSHSGLFILPSFYEGLPIALLEAMSYGLICIVSDIEANRNVELNKDRYFNPDNIDELGKKIENYINKSLNKVEKEQQINMIAKEYNWTNIAYSTLNVYKKILKPSKLPANIKS